jgi:hypothetical protein
LGESEENTNDTTEKQTSSRLWTPYGDPRQPEAKGAEAKASGEEPGEEVSDEELRRRIEEAMEKITVTDVVVDMMVSLSSLAYQRMGIPHDVNEKFRDMEQARLAIDCLEALFKALEGKVPEDMLIPLTGTMDNLKLNYAKEA